MEDGGAYERFYAGVGALVAGSSTYEWILDHLDAADGGEWPYRGRPFWVLSSRALRLPEGEGVDVRIASGSVGERFAEMASSAGEKALWVVGGGNVASQFAEKGLLDEVQLTVVPVVLGSGKPLFDRALPGGALTLTGVEAFGNGMVELRYVVRR